MFSKPFEQIIFSILLAAAVLCLFLAALTSITPFGSAGKMLSSSGMLFALSGLMQLEVSGLFEDVISPYADEDRYPYGPPHHITRIMTEEAVNNPVLIKLRYILFSRRRIGFVLICSGELLQLFGVWF